MFLNISKYFIFFLIFLNISKLFLNSWGVEIIDKVCDPKFLSVSLYLLEISANLSFYWIWRKFYENFEDFRNFDFLSILKNVVLWSLTMHMITNCYMFRSISYRFWDKHFLHQIESFFKMLNPWPWRIEP